VAKKTIEIENPAGPGPRKFSIPHCWRAQESWSTKT